MHQLKSPAGVVPGDVPLSLSSNCQSRIRRTWTAGGRRADCARDSAAGRGRRRSRGRPSRERSRVTRALPRPCILLYVSP